MQAVQRMLAHQEQLQEAYRRQERELAALKCAAVERLSEMPAGVEAAAVSSEGSSGVASAKGCDSEPEAAAIAEVKSQVSVVAGAMNLLLGRVEELSGETPRRHGGAEHGPSAGSAPRPAALLDNLESCQSSPSASSARGTPAPASRLSAGGAVGPAAVDGAQALRKQLAVLMDSVQVHHLPSAEPGAAHGVGLDPALQDTTRSPSSARNSERRSPVVTPREIVVAQALRDKAPSPRKWMIEPLAVSVGRCDHRFVGGVSPTRSPSSTGRSTINAAGA